MDGSGTFRSRSKPSDIAHGLPMPASISQGFDMSKQPDGASRFRSPIFALVSGSLIGASFGRIWLNIAAKDMGQWRTAVEFAGWVVFGLFVIAGTSIALRAPRHRPQRGAMRPRAAWVAWFGVLVVVEVALIAGGQNLLGGTYGHPEWIPVFTLLVVGAHFSAFAVILRIDAFHVLAGALCIVAIVSATVATLAGLPSLWWALPGLGGAVALWGFTGWALYRSAAGGVRLKMNSAPGG